MRIQLINPNTSADMTNAMALSAQSVALDSTQIIACTREHGPKSRRSALLMKSLPSAALLDLIEQGKQQGVDAHIIACFGDPALDAAR